MHPLDSHRTRKTGTHNRNRGYNKVQCRRRAVTGSLPRQRRPRARRIRRVMPPIIAVAGRAADPQNGERSERRALLRRWPGPPGYPAPPRAPRAAKRRRRSRIYSRPADPSAGPGLCGTACNLVMHAQRASRPEARARLPAGVPTQLPKGNMASKDERESQREGAGTMEVQV